MKHKVMGIDPGVSGAVSGIKLKDGYVEAVTLWDMPVVVNGKGKTEIDVGGIVHLITDFNPDDVFLEKAQPMSRYGKRQGVVSTGGYMKGYGILIGVLTVLAYKFEEVTPQAWKKIIFDGPLEKIEGETTSRRLTRTKNRSRARAEDEFLADGLGKRFPLAKDHNRAEAFLIGFYGCKVGGKLGQSS